MAQGGEQPHEATDGLCALGARSALPGTLLVLTALAVVLESGRPVLFRQTLWGCTAWSSALKVRSMVKNRGCDRPYTPRPTTGGSTRVGRFIRRTSIDELPQLPMCSRVILSLVGPRPDVPAQRDLYTKRNGPCAAACVRASPAWPGTAALRGDGAQRLELDFANVREHNPGLDLKIMVWTLKRLTGKGPTSMCGIFGYWTATGVRWRTKRLP